MADNIINHGDSEESFFEDLFLWEYKRAWKTGEEIQQFKDEIMKLRGEDAERTRTLADLYTGWLIRRHSEEFDWWEAIEKEKTSGEG